MGIPQHMRAVVPASKLIDYLLSREHPIGRHKAAFFVSIGFGRAEPRLLEAAILEHASIGSLISRERTRFGDRFVLDGPIRTPSGRLVPLRSVWFASDSEKAVLVTAYPIPPSRAPRIP